MTGRPPGPAAGPRPDGAPAPCHLWIHADAPGEFERARTLLLELARREARYRLRLTARGSAADRRALEQAFPGAVAGPVGR